MVFLLRIFDEHCPLAIAPPEYLGVSLPQGYVLDLGDDKFDPPTGGVEAVVELARTGSSIGCTGTSVPVVEMDGILRRGAVGAMVITG